MPFFENMSCMGAWIGLVLLFDVLSFCVWVRTFPRLAPWSGGACTSLIFLQVCTCGRFSSPVRCDDKHSRVADQNQNRIDTDKHGIVNSCHCVQT